MKKIGLGMSAVIVAIGLFLFWRYATYGHSQEQPASNVHMQQVLEKFYQNPGNYNFFDKDGNSMNAYIMSREKAFQLHPQDVTKEVVKKVNDYSEEVVQELLELHSDEEWIHAFQEYYKKPYIYSLYDKKSDSMKEYALNQITSSACFFNSSCPLPMTTPIPASWIICKSFIESPKAK